MQRRWLIVAAGLAILVPGVPAHAIAHGQNVPDGRYRFSAELEMTGIPTPDGGTRDSSCSGSLVARYWIITAGHCFKDVHDRHVSRVVAARTVAIVGRAGLSSPGGDQATVIAVRQSPTHDIALARLSRAITDVTPIRIATRAPAIGTEVRLTGFGFTSGDDVSRPARMQTGEFRVTSVNGTQVGMSGVAPHTDTSPCERDSGGPYFDGPDTAPVLVALVSRGPDCPHRGADTSARVDTAAPWILSVIRGDLTRPAATPPPTPSPAPASVRPATPAAPLPREPDGSHLRLPLAAAVAGALVLLAPLALLRRRRNPASKHRRR